MAQHSFAHLISSDVTIPEFLKRLQCSDVSEGEKAHLLCQVIGDPVPKILWFKEDGSEIKDNEKYQTSYNLQTAEAELIIKSSDPSDEMSYKCIASNIYGTAKTIGLLVVKAKKSRKSKSPSISPTRCSTPSLSPTKTLSLPVAKQRSVSPLKNIDVPYSNLEPVKEETEHSSSQSEDTTDTLKHKNKQEIFSKNNKFFIDNEAINLLEVKEGEDIKISCNIFDSLDSEILWYKDNKPLKDDHRIDIYKNRGACHLEICDANIDDSGDYAIFSPNNLNKLFSLTRVIVNQNEKKIKRPKVEDLFAYASRHETYHPPQFIIKPASQIVHEESKLSIFCKVEGLPKPEISWFREGKPLKNESIDNKYNLFEKDEKNYLEIENVSILDAGQFTCTVSNVMGAVYSAFNIVVEAMTEPESSDLEKSGKESRKISLSDNNTDTSTSIVYSDLRNKELADMLVEKHVKEHIKRRLSTHSESEKDLLLKEYRLLSDYKDEQREISLFKNDIVEIIDITNPENWLVRTKNKNIIQVCYVPPNFLEQFIISQNKLPDDELQYIFNQNSINSASNFKNKQNMKTNEKPNINNYNGTSRLSKFYYENLSLSEEIKNSNKDGISNLKNNPTSMEYSV